MKHNYRIDGYGFRLRPVKIEDAGFIVSVRLEDSERNRFIHTITDDIDAQVEWIKKYLEREDDYYFVIENRLTGHPEGLIGIYNVTAETAEWGRWVIKKGSIAATESVYLIYRVAFELLGLEELFCRTIELNETVVSFHDSIGETRNECKEEPLEWDGIRTKYIMHISDKENFYNNIAPKLEKYSAKYVSHQRRLTDTKLEFHHIGIATKAIDKELPIYTALGYEKEGTYFEDVNQGIRGIFIVGKDLPRLELLENLEGSITLDLPIKNNQKMYHKAFYVENIDLAIEFMKHSGAKVISEKKESKYFGKQICFLMLKNMELVELLEK